MSLIHQLHKAGVRELTVYDTIVSDPLASRYVAKFMHQTSLLAQFQHAEHEDDTDAEPENLTAI